MFCYRTEYGTDGTPPPLKGGALPFIRSAHLPVKKKIFGGLKFFCRFVKPFSIFINF